MPSDWLIQILLTQGKISNEQWQAWLDFQAAGGTRTAELTKISIIAASIVLIAVIAAALLDAVAKYRYGRQ